jgi:hypothetical protein
MGAGPPTRARVMVHGLLAFGTMPLVPLGTLPTRGRQTG